MKEEGKLIKADFKRTEELSGLDKPCSSPKGTKSTCSDIDLEVDKGCKEPEFLKLKVTTARYEVRKNLNTKILQTYWSVILKDQNGKKYVEEVLTNIEFGRSITQKEADRVKGEIGKKLQALAKRINNYDTFIETLKE